MITIDKEAAQRILQPIDLDKMAERYQTVNKLFTVTSPSTWVYEKNMYFLLKNSVYKSFDPKYTQRPDYLSFDEYGTVVLGPLLMYINNVFTIEDFHLANVAIPKFRAILDVVKDKFPDKEKSELESINW